MCLVLAWPPFLDAAGLRACSLLPTSVSDQAPTAGSGCVCAYDRRARAPTRAHKDVPNLLLGMEDLFSSCVQAVACMAVQCPVSSSLYSLCHVMLIMVPLTAQVTCRWHMPTCLTRHASGPGSAFAFAPARPRLHSVVFPHHSHFSVSCTCT